MAYNEQLADRVREALADLPDLEEKKMFGGLAFLVNGKMCINISKDRLMCRIDPAICEEVLLQDGVHSLTMKGRVYQGYVYVDEEVVKRKKDFDYWVRVSLEYNKVAKPATSSKGSKKRKKV